MYLVTADEMQEMDKKTINSFGLPGRVLMENAGRGAFKTFLKEFGDLSNKKIGIMAGRGNNGGDGFVIARYLFEKEIKTTVYLLSKKQNVQGDAEANLILLDKLGVPVIEIFEKELFLDHQRSMKHNDIWIDAILGTGLNSDVRGYFKEIIEFINSRNKPVFAVDIPSGLHSDFGQPCGTCIRADATSTFAFAKIGHMIHPGIDYTGNLDVVDIGIPNQIIEQINPRQKLLKEKTISGYFKQRSPEAHKGSTGHVLVIAGLMGKTGAAALSAMSAMRAGAGLVTLGIPESINSIIEPMMVEAMTCPLPETMDHCLGESSFKKIQSLLTGKKAIAIGPGIGTNDSTQKLLLKIIAESNIPIIIDADGLNCLVGCIDIFKKIDSPVILTPHPGEMARLIDLTPGQVQKNRINCARNFAENFNVHIVLKGARTIIAHPDGQIFINSTGNPGMASGGMGDVLTGLISGFLAQNFTPESASHAGVYLHGAVADMLAETKGPFGYLASDVMNGIPVEIKNIMS